MQESSNLSPLKITPKVPETTEETKVTIVDRYGFLESDSRFKGHVEPQSKQHIWLENRRTQKWIKMTGQDTERWDAVPIGKKKSRIRKGIPEAVRSRIWRRMTDACMMMKNNPGVYHKYLAEPSIPCQESILRDVGRTFPKHLLFVREDSLGQSALTNVLSAYSLHDPQVGYCQGMGFISALFLSYMPEEETFWLLVSVMTSKKHALADLYRPGMPKVSESMFVFEKLVEKYLPRVHVHFDKEGLHPTMYASQWFITLYSYSFSFDLVTKIWDMFLHEGWKIIYRVALAILKLTQKQLLALDFERSMEFFHSLPHILETRVILSTALKIPLKSKEIAQLEQLFKSQS